MLAAIGLWFQISYSMSIAIGQWFLISDSMSTAIGQWFIISNIQCQQLLDIDNVLNSMSGIGQCFLL